MVETLEGLRWQFGVAWRFGERFVLPHLSDAACLWLPGGQGVSVHRASDNRWVADWPGEEVDGPPPVASVGWLTWHVQWWWSGAIAGALGVPGPDRDEVSWAGDADSVRAELAKLAGTWSDVLDRTHAAELDSPTSYPIEAVQPRWRLYAWVNFELTKNLAEIGDALRFYALDPAAVVEAKMPE